MQDKKQLFTVSIYTENNIGLLNRISAIFQRRHINIESINSSVSEIEEVTKFTIVVNLSENLMKKIIHLRWISLSILSKKIFLH